LLEVELVEHRLRRLGHDRGRAHPPPSAMRHAQGDDGPEPVRTQQSRVPGDRRAPVVADDDCRRLAQGVEEPDEIADQVEQCVLIDRLRAVGATVAPLVGRHRVVAGLAEGAKLVPPRVPGLRPAVAQQHERPCTVFGDVHSNAIGFNDPVHGPAHDENSTSRETTAGTLPPFSALVREPPRRVPASKGMRGGTAMRRRIAVFTVAALLTAAPGVSAQLYAPQSLESYFRLEWEVTHGKK